MQVSMPWFGDGSRRKPAKEGGNIECSHSVEWGPGLNKEEKSMHEKALCFLNVGAMWSLALTSSWQDFLSHHRLYIARVQIASFGIPSLVSLLCSRLHPSESPPRVSSSPWTAQYHSYRVFKSWSPDLPATCSPAFPRVTWELCSMLCFVY